MKFWIGQSISVFGSQFSPFAIQAIAISVLVGSDTQLGLLAFFNTIPFLTLGLFVGVWADRHRRRRIMILADFGRASILFCIPAFYFLFGVGGLSFNLLYVVTLVAGILTVFFEIAYQANIPNLVERSQIVEANSKLETTRSIGTFAGPSVAGVLLAVFTKPLVVFGDVLGYLTSSFTLLSLKRPEVMSPAGPPKSTWHDIREGLAVVFGDPRLRSIAATTATANLFGSAYNAILLIYLHNNLSLSYTAIGFALGLGSLGGVVGGLTARRFIDYLGVGRSIVLSILIAGLFPVSFYFATPDTAFVIAILVTFFGSLGALWYNIPQVSYRQALVPREVQGRMNATMRTIVWGIIPIGSILGGVVGDLIGTHATVGLMAVLGSAAFLWVFFSPIRKVKDFPTA